MQSETLTQFAALVKAIDAGAFGEAKQLTDRLSPFFHSTLKHGDKDIVVIKWGTRYFFVEHFLLTDKWSVEEAEFLALPDPTSLKALEGEAVHRLIDSLLDHEHYRCKCGFGATITGSPLGWSRHGNAWRCPRCTSKAVYK